MAIVTFAAALILIITIPATAEILLLTAGALLPTRRQKPKFRGNLKTAVVIAAHNEENNLGRTLESLKKCRGIFTVVVVAHNCSDSSGSIAKKFGAHLLTLDDTGRVGKCYALDHAFRALRDDDYDIFVVVDADTIVDANLIETCTAYASAGANAIQVPYIAANVGDNVLTRIAAISLMAANLVRPRGRSRLGLSAGILGNGFAITRRLLDAVPFFETPSPEEEGAYHLRLILNGYKVHFAEESGVKALMPRTLHTASTKWVQGRLQLLASITPLLLKEIASGNRKAIEPLLDLFLPPLSYYLVLILISAAASPTYAAAAFALTITHLIIAIVLGKGNGRDIAALCFLPYYLSVKMAVLFKLPRLFGNENRWKGTPRD